MNDFEADLGQLSPVEAAICRQALLEGRSFAEIAASLPGRPDRSTVKRLFDRCIGVIRASLKEYDRGPGCVAFPEAYRETA
jgi:hypothetical protein